MEEQLEDFFFENRELTGSFKVCHISHEMKPKSDLEGPTLGQKKIVHFQSVEKVKVQKITKGAK